MRFKNATVIIAAMAVAPTFNFPVEARTLVKGNTKNGKAVKQEGVKASSKNPVKSTKGPGSKSVSSSKMPKSNGKSGKVGKSKSTVVLTSTPTPIPTDVLTSIPTSSPPTESPTSSPTPLTEELILRKLYASTDGEDNWNDNSNWLSGDYCNWYGVTCTNGVVTGKCNSHHYFVLYVIVMIL